MKAKCWQRNACKTSQGTLTVQVPMAVLGAVRSILQPGAEAMVLCVILHHTSNVLSSRVIRRHGH